jgi:spore photoproduct lyase
LIRTTTEDLPVPPSAIHRSPAPAYLYVESGSRDDQLTGSLHAAFPDSEVFEIRDHRRLDEESVPVRGTSARIKKEVLVLARHDGPFIRPFPGSARGGREEVYLIAHANGCPFDCRYCFLQSYFDHGAPVLFTNLDDLYRELEEHLQTQEDGSQATYHAGEFSDALAFEALTGFASRAIPIFARHPAARLELRTKCTGVENLLPASPPPNVTVSWTLTPKEAWRRYEPGTPDPASRLASARACQEMGYRVGVRLDPILLLADWERAYDELLGDIFRRLLPDQVESFVLGGFRYTSVLGNRVRERFPSCDLLAPEFVLCRDGKYRYFRPLRVRLYRRLSSAILGHNPNATVRLSMETDLVQAETLAR